MASLAWDLKTQVVQGRLAVVNACAENHEYGMVKDEFYVAALTARIEHPTCELQEAKRLVLDGTGALFLLLRGSLLLRCEL